MPVECLCVGILVADHLSTPISHLPPAGQLVLAERLPLAVGGCAANAAVDLARVGVNVAVVGCVGRDVFGEFIVRSLAAAGANTDSIELLPDADTSGTLIVNVAGEDRRFIHAIGANGRFEARHIPMERVRQAKVLYVGGYMVMPALEAGRLADVFRQARAAGVKTVLDIVLPGPGDHWPQLSPVLAETDIFLPNTDEAAVITGLKDPREQALRFRESGAGTVVITSGGEGTVLVNDRVRLHSRAYPVTYVGGTGAGDAFDAGFITGLLAGADERGCLEWGSALGASCVRSISATDSVFSRAEAVDFMRANRLEITAW
jgi:sugar/nucleoside kinase (ribokinase family)